MDPKLLRYFLAVAQELHYGRAAKRLHISQPPLTRHIQQLEAEIGARLFDRNKRHVALTPAGATLVQEAQRLLAQGERALREVQRAERGEIGRIRIGFVAAVLFMSIDSVFARLTRELPNIDITWEEMGSSEQLDALRQDRIDIGFGQVDHDMEDMARHRVASVPLAAALPRGHRMARRPVLQLADLSDAPFIAILRDSAPNFHDLTISACMQAGYSPNIRHHARHLVSIVSMVAMGHGVSLVPQPLERAAIPGVRLRPLGDVSMQVEYSAIWNPESRSPALPRALRLLGVPAAALSRRRGAP